MHTSFLFSQVMTFTPCNCIFHFRKSCATCAHVRGSVRCGLIATLFSAATANRRLHYHSCSAPHDVLDDRPPKGFYVSPLLQSSSKKVWLATWTYHHLRSSSQYDWHTTQLKCTITTNGVTTCICHHFWRFPHSVRGRPPEEIVHITSLSQFLAMCLAGHQTEVTK